MKIRFFASLVALTVLAVFAFGPQLFAAAPALQKAMQDAESRGYLLVTTREEIVANAKREGTLRVLHSFQPETMNAIKAAFAKRYPFINLSIQEITGTEASQRLLMEVKGGVAHGWDVIHLTSDFYSEHVPYLEKIDVLGMAENGVLQITPKMIDPDTRNTVAASTTIGAVGYNKDLLPATQVPKTWEDFLRPELKGRKFLVDLRPNNLAGLVPAMGKEWVLNYARQLAAQEPIWVRGVSRALTAMAAGEYSLHQLLYYHNVAEFKSKSKNLDFVLLEPVPVRLTEPYGIPKGAKNRHAAMLLLEFLCSAEGQKIIDDVEPLKSSIYFSGSKVEQTVRGKKISLVEWRQFDKIASYMKEIVAAFGFPKAEKS